MLFTTTVFLFYFLPVTLAVTYLIRSSIRLQNIWILFVSLFFYAWGDPASLVLLCASAIVNYGLGLAIDSARQNRPRAKRFLLLGCVVNLGLLFFFKYLGFALRSFALLMPFEAADTFHVRPPLGISFFTFQALSYLINVYRRDERADRNPLNVALYITFFPRMISGPITRYVDAASQIRERRITRDDVSYGVCRFITGLAKKVLVSNAIATVVDYTYRASSMSHDLTKVPASLAWLGAVAYLIQLYFDFSGYSDMAIGLGRMFGFRIKENFDYPYVSLSMTDFWRRWHISLLVWIREYIYFPLGGSRVSNSDKMVKNMFIVWLLTGIWHGAALNFILWGMWHFIFLVFERVIEFPKRKIPRVIRHFYVIFVFMIGLVIFRAEGIYELMLYLSNMLGLNSNGFFSEMTLMFLKEYWAAFAAGILFSMPLAPRLAKMISEGRMGRWGNVLAAGYPVMMILLFFVTVSYLARGTYNPFVYFNF